MRTVIARPRTAAQAAPLPAATNNENGTEATATDAMVNLGWLVPEEANPLIVPLTTWATLRWAQAWSARASYRGLLRLADPLGPEDRYLHGVSSAVAYAWPDSRLELSLFVPLDPSLLALGMLSVGTSYARSF